MKLNRFLYLMCFWIFLASNVDGHSDQYPKILGVSIGNPSNYDDKEYQVQLAKADAIVLNFWPHWKDYKYGDFAIERVAKNIKQINPGILIGQYSILTEAQDSDAKDKSNLDRAKKIDLQGWWLYDENGKKTQWTSSFNAWDVNITSYAKPDKNGLFYSEWLAKRNYNLLFRNNPQFDFWFLDNSLNLSPVKYADWKSQKSNQSADDQDIASAYRSGHVRYWNEIRRLQPKTMLIGNTDMLSSSEYSKQLNGALIEAAIGKKWSIETRQGWTALLDRYYSFMEHTLPPHLIGFNVWGKSNDFQRLRYGLTTCLLNDGYFSYTDEDKGYSSLPWFDEYDIELGAPVEAAPKSSWQNGVFKRAFEKGIVLVNPTDSKKTVALGKGFRHFEGSQAPDINNGQSVTQVTISPKDGLVLIIEAGYI